MLLAGTTKNFSSSNLQLRDGGINQRESQPETKREGKLALLWL